MNEAATTIPPGLVGNIVKNRPLPEPILILIRIWKIPPPCKLRKKRKYISGRLFFFLRLVKYAEIRSTDVSKKTFILKHPSFSV